MRRFVLFVLCLPANALGLAIAAIGSLGSRPQWVRREGVLIMRPCSGSFIARHWRYSTALCHVIVWHPDHDEAVLEHERIHVLQAEACCLGWWLLTLVAWSSTLLLLSPFAWLAIYGASCAAAWLGGAEAYRGNVFERHARAETAEPVDDQRGARDCRYS